MRALATALLLGLVVALPTGAAATPRVAAPGNHDLTLTIGGRTRRASTRPRS